MGEVAEGRATARRKRRVLLLATTTGYQTRMFEEAAASAGVEIVYGTDRCDHLEDPWRDGAIAVRFEEEAASLRAIEEAVARRPVDGVLAVGDRPAVLAASTLRVLGLPGHPPEAAAIARDKRRMRERLRDAGLPAPETSVLEAGDDPAPTAAALDYPVVVKPTTLSGSRGVIRADDPASFVAAVDRIRRLLASPDIRVSAGGDPGVVQVERYIAGAEYALEGLLEHGALRVLAIFDKPDPLEGPFFEETLYVTPSRAAHATQQAIVSAVAAAAHAMGLHHGPIHAECRVAADGVYVLEVAARPIGGLCARALRFVRAGESPAGRVGLEALLLRHAHGEPASGWVREPEASGVMMIPIPRGGVFRRVVGLEAARAVPGIDDVVITAKSDQRLVPLPEGASYLGFIFARADTSVAVEQALRDAHAALRVTIDPYLPVVSG
jgi:predicted ATP-grasp superfamily ATP-dependent carboligase